MYSAIAGIAEMFLAGILKKFNTHSSWILNVMNSSAPAASIKLQIILADMVSPGLKRFSCLAYPIYGTTTLTFLAPKSLRFEIMNNNSIKFSS